MSEWHDKARAMKKADPTRSGRSIADELGVTQSAVWKALNPERVREYWEQDREAKNARTRKYELNHRTPCTNGCGELASMQSTTGLCRACWEAEAERVARARAQEMDALWRAGVTWGDLAARFGWGSSHLSAEMARVRERWPELLPYRRTPEQRERIRAGRWAA